ncbi:hypothetical protein [Streptomyces sp. NPDC056600]|uniref:hypothetical protein n=1 Tax=Streptomyces sp. NPDC056600 TaxID=3345874 RepID=UPI0036C72CA1
MAGINLEALEDVPWERLESALAHRPPQEMRRELRRLALKGGAATEEDCYPLFDCFAFGTGRVASVQTAALPFVVALAGDPDMTGVRATLAELLACASEAAAEADPDLVDAGWYGAWRAQRPGVLALLSDPLPEVRREALPLAEDVGVLLERWHAETDPTVRLPLLLTLGSAAADAVEDGLVDRVRAVVAEALRTDSPVMRVAAVHAWARFEPGTAVRELDALVEVLSDVAVRPQFEEIWYVPGVEGGAFTREAVLSWTASLFDGVPSTALAFVVRLIGAARRNGDALLCRAALDEGWRLLVVRPSVASVLLPLAGALLAEPDDGVRYRAAHLMAVLGSRAAPYADQLAALLDDAGEAEFLEGTVGDHARWALTRIGDGRALPGLVERLYAPYKAQYSRAYVMGDPRLPEVEEVLMPLRAHAETLLPAVRKILREDARGGPLTCGFLKVLKAWGPAALPALPEVVTLLDDARYSLHAVDALVAMGPAAASAEPAVRGCTVLDSPGNLRRVAWAVWRLGGDRDAALRLIGEAVRTGEAPLYGPVGLLGDFGPAAAGYAGRVRQVMEHGDGWPRLQAAVALWSITGETEPSASVLEEHLHPVADDGAAYGHFREALRALARFGTVSAAARTTLRRVRDTDRRLSHRRDYRAFLQDEETRAAIDEVLHLP